MRAAAAAAMLLLGGCASVPPMGVPLTGQWGGRHVGLSLTPAGGTVDYDCAAGTIDAPLIPARDGSFSTEGRHTPGTGGPERIGEVPPSYRARYSGRVRGDRLTLTVRVENGVLIGPYELRRGAEPILMRCL